MCSQLQDRKTSQKRAVFSQAELSQAIAEAGVDPHRLRLMDGSGMCAKNWITPRASMELLQGKHEDLVFDSFLPVAACDTALTSATGQKRLEGGTLARRFHGTRAAGELRAKTGTLGGTAALSGYLLQPMFIMQASISGFTSGLVAPFSFL